jgi:outer membrane protein assembly factor BamB
MKRAILNYVIAFTVLATTVGYTAHAESGAEIIAKTGVTGGLIVHLGCGTGERTASLRVNDSFRVHGLNRDAAQVMQARAHINARGLATQVTISRLHEDTLPFIDNLVNLVVVEKDCAVPQAEIMRILCPGGTAYFRQGSQGRAVVKSISSERDEWTHYLYDASNNAVSKDSLVDQPRHMQFRTDLEWSRNHDKQASVSGVVTTQGRMFYVMDSGPGADMSVPARWSIVARDAYNGVFLWQRSIGSWTDHRRGFRSGPAQLPRLLVAQGDRVYVPLSVQQPLVALDAASGKTRCTYKGTEGTEEVLLLGQTLLVVTGTPFPTQAFGLSGVQKATAKHLMAFRAEDGKLLWHKQALDPEAFVTCTLAADEGCVYYRYDASVVCLDRQTGKEIWTNPKVVAPAPVPRNAGKRKPKVIKPNSNVGTSTLVVKHQVLVLSDGRNVTALSARDGQILWSTKGRPGFRSPQDVFVIDSTVWLGGAFTQGFDLKSGELVKENDLLQVIQTAGHHHRCYRNKATERYIIAGHRGIEFLDLNGNDHGRNNWVRGLCQYGVMPANGLIYAPPHSCGCYMEAKLYGFWALAPESRIVKSELGRVKERNDRLEKGPAYNEIHPSPFTLHNSKDWPTLRQNGRRSGVTPMTLPAQLKRAWQVKLGQDLTAPVAAGGTVLVADTDSHTVYAVDTDQGKKRWLYRAGARIDSPPTIYENMAIFGCRDGWVYSLRVTDGALAWRFRAAPADLRSVDRDQVESLWPVCGSVLVQDGKVYCAAGRNSYLDGGLFLYALDARTGKLVHQRRMHSQAPKILDKVASEKLTEQYPAKTISQNKTDYRTFVSADKSDGFSMAGALNDVISGDGEHVYLRHLTCNTDWQEAAAPVPHLFSTSSFVDDNENHRSHMTMGLGFFGRTIYAYPWIPKRFGPNLYYPMGLMLVYQGGTAWGIQRGSDYVYTLFQKDIPQYKADDPEYKNDLIRTAKKDDSTWTWSIKPGMRPRAMIKAGDRIYIGGMPVTIAGDPYATFEGRGGGLLQVRSAANGELLNTIKLDSPVVWDGLAVAQGRLYGSCQDGSLLCLQ